MSLAVRSELAKLRQQWHLDDQALPFLEQLPETQLRELRTASSELLFAQNSVLFRRLAKLANRFSLLAPWLAKMIGPLLTARIVGEIPARNAARIAARVEPAYVAQIAAFLDPRRTRDLIQFIHKDYIVEVALALIERRDYPTMGRFVSYLNDEVLQAVLDAVDDEAELLRAAFFMDSKNRLSHVVRMLPQARRRKVVLLALDEKHPLLDEIMCVLANVNFALKRELGDLAAAQDDAVIARVIAHTQQAGLWGDLMPVVASLSQTQQKRIANLPILSQQPEVIESLVLAADQHNLWLQVLPLAGMLEEPMLQVLAQVAAQLPHAAIERAAQAVLIGEYWEVMFDVIRRMPFAKQCDFVQVLKDLSGSDALLDARLLARAKAHGLQRATDAVGLIAA